MKIKEVIKMANMMEKGNVLEPELAIFLLSELDGMIQSDMMLHAPEEIVSYTDQEQELLLRKPHDGIYLTYLVAMIRQCQGEFEGYENAQKSVEEKLRTFKRWYIQHYRPADTASRSYTGGTSADAFGFAYLTAYGLAVKHGYRGTEEEWLESLEGKPGDPGEAARMRFDAERGVIQWGVGDEWYDLFTLEELKDPVVEELMQEVRALAEAARNSEAAARGHAKTAADAAADALGSAGRAYASEQNAVTAWGDAQVQAETAQGYMIRSEKAAKEAEDAAADALGSAGLAYASEQTAVTAAGDAQVQAETAQGYAIRAEAAAKKAEEAAAGAGTGGNGSGSGQNPDLTGVVKSVNGIKPDADGNVNISGSDIKWMYVTVEIEDEIPCTGITLDKSALAFTGAGQQTIVATVTPADTTDTLVWTSSKPSVATVANGVVTAYANGSATITATCGEYSASCTVEVSGISSTVAVTGITLDKATATVQAGSTITLTATVKPDNATNKTVLWSSDDETVAKVVDGVVTGISEGTASIGVMTADGGFSAVCNVTVAAASNYKNLFDKDTMVVGGGIRYDGIIASNWGMAKVPVKENTVYSLKTTDATTDVGYYGAPTAGSIGFADSTGNTLIYNLILGDPSRAETNGINADLKEYAHGDVEGYTSTDGTVEWVTFTTPAGCAYLLFNTALKNNADKIQLEEGDTIHNYYLPYNGGDA